MTAPHDRSPDEIKKLLLGEHGRIDTLLTQLHDQAETDVRPDLERTWSELERALLAHMDAEEEYLLPALSRENAAEAAAIAAEHASFRKQLGEIGIGIELRTVRLPAIAALKQDLLAHASREDALLYRWAASSGEPGAITFVRRFLRRIAGA